MSDGHHHDHAHDHGLGHHHHGSGRALLIAVGLTLGFALVEAVGGWLSGSLALLSDAGHMITDSSSLAVGALAAWLSRRPASRWHSFGLQRAEVLGALFNAVVMLLLVGAIAWSAVLRLLDPQPVTGGMVMIIAALGLAINTTLGVVLLRSERTMNVRGALLHVMGDLLGSVAALVAGLVIMLSGWMPIDPLLSLLVSALISISALSLLRDVTRVLMEGVPRGLDMDRVAAAMLEVAGVNAVHDLHVWSLSSRQRALAAHVEIAGLQEWEAILPRLQQMLSTQFDIAHTTLQPENRRVARDCVADPMCGTTL